MFQSSTLYSLMIAGLLALSNSGIAAVHDFGNMQPFSPDNIASNPDSGERTVTYSRGLDLTSSHMSQSTNNFSFNINPLADSSFASSNKVGAAGNEHDVDFLGESLGQKVHDKHFVSPSPVIPATESRESYVSPITPSFNTVATPVPEPETYAMILAGLALIGFTTRRRDRNS